MVQYCTMAPANMCGCSPRVMREPVKEANRFDMSNGVICSQRAGRDRLERCAAM